MSLREVFQRFYDTPAEIGELTEGTGYLEDEETFVRHGGCMVDYQPYSGGLATREYGVTAEVTARVFSADPEDLLEGRRVAVIGGMRYDIVYAEAWEAGKMALLRRRR